jgi:hypothetical protein
MHKSAGWGLLLILVGVVLNNYAYLNDIVMQKHDGYIYVGSHAVAAIVVSLIVIGIGAGLAARRSPPPDTP